MPKVMLNIPSQIIIGDTVTWNDSGLRGNDPTTGEVTDYTSNNYTLSYAIRGNVALNVSAIANDTGFRTTITSAGSGTLTPGLYFWQAFVTDLSNNRVTICSGQIRVVSNLAVGTAPFDGRTNTKQMLDAVEAAIIARLKGGAVVEYQIKGRDLKRDPLPDLIKFRDQLRMQVAREEQSCKGSKDGRRLYVRFK